jgi:hypothetical protein
MKDWGILFASLIGIGAVVFGMPFALLWAYNLVRPLWHAPAITYWQMFAFVLIVSFVCGYSAEASKREETPMSAVCIKCKHHIGPRSTGTIWYDHFCGKTRRQVYDPVVGTEHEELGHCRTINKDGNCPWFEPCGWIRKTICRS